MSKRIFIFSLALVLLLLPFLSFTYWPEMLSRPFFLLHGKQPYTDIIMEHAPLLPYLLAGWFKLFGLGFSQLRLFTWTVITLTAALVYLFSRSRPAVLLYLVFALAYSGNGVWYDLALTPVIFLVFFLLFKHHHFLAGFIFVTAFFIKQTAVWFIPPLLFTLYPNSPATKKFMAGSGLALAVWIIHLLFLGVFTGFIRWAFVAPAPAVWPTLTQAVFAFAPFVVLWLPSTINHKLFTHIRLLSLFGTLGAFPRWELFHLQPALPFLTLAIVGFFSIPGRIITKSVYLAIMTLFLLRQFNQIWLQPDRFSEPDFLQTVEYVKDHTLPSDTILVQNTWESLYALSDRLPPAPPYYPYLPWYLDLPGVQEKIVSNLHKNPPALVVVGQTQSSGLGSYIPPIVDSYLKQNYKEKAKIGSLYVWQ